MRTKGLNEENSTIENLAATAKPSFQSQKRRVVSKKCIHRKVFSEFRYQKTARK